MHSCHRANKDPLEQFGQYSLQLTIFLKNLSTSVSRFPITYIHVYVNNSSFMLIQINIHLHIG